MGFYLGPRVHALADNLACFIFVGRARLTHVNTQSQLIQRFFCLRVALAQKIRNLDIFLKDILYLCIFTVIIAAAGTASASKYLHENYNNNNHNNDSGRNAADHHDLLQLRIENSAFFIVVLVIVLIVILVIRIIFVVIVIVVIIFIIVILIIVIVVVILAVIHMIQISITGFGIILILRNPAGLSFDPGNLIPGDGHCLGSVRHNLFHKVDVRGQQRLLQIRNQLRHVGIPAVRTLFRTFQNDMLQAYGNIRRIDPGRHNILLQMLHRHDHCRLSVKRHTSGHHLIHDDTQRIDIALGITVAASGLLRRRVVHGTHGVRRVGIGRYRLCDSKICHFYFPLTGNNDVLRLDIPVYDLIVVRNLQTGRHLNGNAGSFFYRQPAFFLNISLQGDAFHQLHHNIIDVLLITHIIHIYNIRMSQGGSRLGLLLKLADKISVLYKLILQNLHRHKTVQLMILSLKDLCHAAGAYFLQNFIAIS